MVKSYVYDIKCAHYKTCSCSGVYLTNRVRMNICPLMLNDEVVYLFLYLQFIEYAMSEYMIMMCTLQDTN